MIFRRKSKPVPPPPYVGPTIKAAAIRHAGEILTGTRHAYIMDAIWKKYGQVRITQEVQGFLGSDGEFYSRVEAGLIAFRAGQTKVHKERLLSEHVW